MRRRDVIKSLAGMPLLPTFSLLDTDLTDSYTVVESHYKKIVREWRHSRKVVYLTYREVQDDIVAVVYKTPQTLTVYSYIVEIQEHTHGVSDRTVRRVIKELHEEGLIRKENGYYYPLVSLQPTWFDT